MTDTKMRTLDTIQLNRQKLHFHSYPKPKKQLSACMAKYNFFIIDLVKMSSDCGENIICYLA